MNLIPNSEIPICFCSLMEVMLWQKSASTLAYDFAIEGKVLYCIWCWWPRTVPKVILSPSRTKTKVSSLCHMSPSAGSVRGDVTQCTKYNRREHI